MVLPTRSSGAPRAADHVANDHIAADDAEAAALADGEIAEEAGEIIEIEGCEDDTGKAPSGTLRRRLSVIVVLPLTRLTIGVPT